ncbi:MAG: outer membrane beta-barrel protein [Opitutus sp.]
MARLISLSHVRVILVGGLLASGSLRAVYAPIPEQEQGEDMAFSMRAGISHDSNLFGAATNETSSVIFTIAPRVVYNASLTAQTFFSGAYGLTLDYFEGRPGKKLLDSHDLNLRVAHQFSKATTVDVNNLFMISRNPESLLAGVPLNPDQSFQRNQLDARLDTAINAKVGLTVKARSVYYKYRNATLGRSLDRIENLYGVSGDYAVLPEMKAVAEYRHQEVFYRKLGETKNKTSDFIMAGFDYEVAQKLSASARVGAEFRRRAAERDVTSPYAELTAKYDYARASFILGGYGYSFDESSDTTRFTDMQVNRFFVNVQHSITALIVGSVSIGFEPSQLQGRRGVADVDEDTTRLGAALSYLPTKDWTISASYDYDRVNSDDPARGMKRSRVALNASHTF